MRIVLTSKQERTNMKTLAIASAAAGILLMTGTAFAYHPVDRNVRGTLEQEQRERIDFEDVQRGVFHSVLPARTVRPSARPARQGADAVPPYLTEHHTR
jgi:hypothetical protein